jgi:hypothetical protein
LAPRTHRQADNDDNQNMYWSLSLNGGVFVPAGETRTIDLRCLVDAEDGVNGRVFVGTDADDAGGRLFLAQSRDRNCAPFSSDSRLNLRYLALLGSH